jgi:uncharacterized protein (DUF4415 family)
MKKKLNEEGRRRELDRLATLPDASIDTSDIPELSLEELRTGRRRDLFRPIKKPVTMRIDADILEWLKRQGPGYQTKLNQMLRAGMAVAEERISAAPTERSVDDTKWANAEASVIRSLHVWNEPVAPSNAAHGARIWESKGCSSPRTPSANTPSSRTPQRKKEAA